MTEAGNITNVTLDEIRREIEADSALFAERLLPHGAGAAACGYSGLFAAAAGGDLGNLYRLPIEYIFEGYLLHYGASRLLAGVPDSFNLLAGDYMYARGLDRLAATGDLFSIRILADLISLCSYVHCQELDAGLSLRAWSLAVICIAARRVGVDGPCGDCLSTFDGIKSGAWDGSVGRGEVDALTARMLASFSEDGRRRI
ncbi:MAG: hypothetical protein AAB281_06535, partial [Actinomycetota bacterium]